MAYDIKKLNEYYKAAKSRRSNADQLLQDVYQYAIPYRDMMYNKTEGTEKNADIFDSTAIDSTTNFANFIHESFTPAEYRWMEYSAGNEIPDSQRERVQTLLDVVTERFFQLLGSTNFDTEINQCYHDLAGGTGVLGIRDYGKFGSTEDAATFVATPPYEIFFAEGREGHISMVFRRFEVTPDRVKTIWPDAELPEGYDRVRYPSTNAENKVAIVEACYYDYDTKEYQYSVFDEAQCGEFFVNTTNKYASWIVFRWSVVSGEQFGRGPLINAMPDIKTVNKVVEMILMNASISISGIYTAVDDGILNPANVVLEPGVIIPVGSNGNGAYGRSLDVLPRNGEFDVSQLVLNDLRQSIRRKLLDDDVAPLDQAVRSSREVALRQQMLARRGGPSIGRLRTELAFSLVHNLTAMWQAKGLLPPFEIDGKSITIRFTSPLAKQQRQEDLQDLDSYIARMNALQPGLAPIAVKPEEYVHYVQEKTGIPLKLIPSRDELRQVQQQMGQAIAQGGPAGQAIVEGFSG